MPASAQPQHWRRPMGMVNRRAPRSHYSCCPRGTIDDRQSVRSTSSLHSSDFFTCVPNAWAVCSGNVDDAQNAEKLNGFCFIHLDKPREQRHCKEYCEHFNLISRLIQDAVDHFGYYPQPKRLTYKSII